MTMLYTYSQNNFSNKVLKIEILVQLDLVVWSICVQKFSKTMHDKRIQNSKQRPALKFLRIRESWTWVACIEDDL